MPKCEKCGVEVSKDDLYDEDGLKVCGDCKIEGIKPPELHAYFSRIKKTIPEASEK